MHYYFLSNTTIFDTGYCYNIVYMYQVALRCLCNVCYLGYHSTFLTYINTYCIVYMTITLWVSTQKWVTTNLVDISMETLFLLIKRAI